MHGSHPLGGGGTASNILGTPAADLSETSLETILVQISEMTVDDRGIPVAAIRSEN
jgi:hypothetical protein